MERESATPTFTVSRETVERGKRLAKARKDEGLRQEDLAAELCAAGLIPAPRGQTVSEWELGAREPSLEQLTWLRDRLAFDWGWFFSGADPKKELAAYRRMAKIVLATEGATPPGAPREGIVDAGATVLRGDGTTEEEAS
jgi:transcriptional regulator with XRE-family HTH domain